MFDFPPQAKVNRVLPKSKVYEFARPSRAVRDRFVRQTGEIVWKYKLARKPSTFRPGKASGRFRSLELLSRPVN